jgi:magnesium transporter
MVESLSTVSEKSGLPPGSLIHVGDVLQPVSRISVMDFGTDHLQEPQIVSIDELEHYKKTDSITWVMIEGLADVNIIERIGQLFGIHQLVLEDILNTHQRARFEEFDDHLYIVLKCLLPETGNFDVRYEQVSLLVLDNFVFTFKEKQDELFFPLQQRVRNPKSRLRSMGTDYLTYAILDIIVDQNFVLIDSLDDVISELEDQLLLAEPDSETLNTIQKLKREVISIRRHISPLRELIAGMLRSESPLINDKTHIYLRDVYDHSIRVIESIESYREILTGLLDIYISNISNKMNEVMKVLTVFASIFIPLTFLAGIYGMNFEYMPELKWKWAYPVLGLAFILIPLLLIVYFKRRKWL